MLNIKSKKEVEQAVHDNLNRFTQAKKSIIEMNMARDEAIILSDILPRLRHTIALTHYIRHIEWFDFSLPLIDMGKIELSQEEKDIIIHDYYHKEGTLWLDNNRLGEVSKVSQVSAIFAEIFQTNILFKSCEVNVETNTVHFRLRLVEKLKKAKVKEEQAAITAIIDDYLLPHLHFNKIAEQINACYECLKGEGLLAVYESDLEYYPVLSLNIDEIVNQTNFYTELAVPDPTLKINISAYVKQSKLIKSLQRKLKKYGYVLQCTTTDSKEEWFRSNGINMSIYAYYPSKDVKDESLVKSETLIEVFDQKRAAYVEALEQKAQKQNEQLIALVESGHFDEAIKTQWVKATLMSTVKLTDHYFRGKRRIDEDMVFHFTVPFDRDLQNTTAFKRTHCRGDGVGIRYMKLTNNMVAAMKKRYPFFENARIGGEPEKDFQAREEVLDSDTYRWLPDTLTFGFVVNHSTYVVRKEQIFTWLASSYGVLPIDDILKDIGFNDEGISQQIEAYVHHHKERKTSAKVPFKIIIGKVASNRLFGLYQNSPLYAQSKELFDDEHRDEFWSYWHLKEAYKEAKKEEFRSLKLANHFVHALVVHPLYGHIKEALKKLDYELKIEYKKELIEKMKTGNYSINDNDIHDDVCQYSVQLVIE